MRAVFTEGEKTRVTWRTLRSMQQSLRAVGDQPCVFVEFSRGNDYYGSAA